MYKNFVYNPAIEKLTKAIELLQAASMYHADGNHRAEVVSLHEAGDHIDTAITEIDPIKVSPYVSEAWVPGSRKLVYIINQSYEIVGEISMISLPRVCVNCGAAVNPVNMEVIINQAGYETYGDECRCSRCGWSMMEVVDKKPSVYTDPDPYEPDPDGIPF